MPNEWMIKLKDGTDIDGRLAVVELECIKDELRENPELILKMHDYASGENPNVEVLRELISGVFFANGRLRQVTKAILLNAFVKEGSSLKVVDPFEHDATTDNVLATIDENNPICTERLIRELRQNSGDSRGPRTK